MAQKGRPREDGEEPVDYRRHIEVVDDMQLLRSEELEPCLYEEDPEKAYLWARDTWWRGRESAKDIAGIIDIPAYQLNTWINGRGQTLGWKEHKEDYNKKYLRRLLISDRERIDDTLKKMYGVVEQSVDRLLDNNHILSISETNSFTSSIEKLFKVRQLIMGSPTDIFAGDMRGEVTWATVVNKIKEVDILDYEMPEAVEHEEPTDHDTAPAPVAPAEMGAEEDEFSGISFDD